MSNFTDKQILAAWNNASSPPASYDQALYRLDPCGALIYWHSYGKSSDKGWQVDHIFPTSKGGGDDYSNLRAMHHSNNASKGDSYPKYSCAVRMTGTGAPTDRTVNATRRKSLAKLYGKKAL